ncbi:MAG: DUF3810 domain-containing protein [Gemmatimonadales bacterium]
MNKVLGFPQDRPLRIRRRLGFLAFGLVCYLVSIVAAWIPGVTEVTYGKWLGPFLARRLSLATGFVPISLAEPVVLGVIASQAVRAVPALRDVIRGSRRWRNAAAAGVLRLGQDAGALVALFYVLWGFNYSRPPLQERLGWTTVDDASVTELAALITQLTEASNSAYLEIHGTTDAGHPTELPMGRRALAVSLERGWEKGRRELGLPAPSKEYGPPKTPLFTHWYEWIGVAGFYFPFTAEANLRSGIPAMDVPKMLAHEMAHQRGTAREAEANFWGYISCANAKDPYARYSAYLFAQLQLMSGLRRTDRDQWRQLVSMMLPGIRRDVDASQEYWESFRGRGTEIGTRVNDAYLRSNRVAGGVKNYSRSALLFIAYARTRGGRLVPADQASAQPEKPYSSGSDIPLRSE